MQILKLFYTSLVPINQEMHSYLYDFPHIPDNLQEYFWNNVQFPGPEIKEAKLTIHELFTTGESSYFGTVPFGPLKIVF